MADISTELANIMSAIYGEEVRTSIHDAIQKMNTQLNSAASSTLNGLGFKGDLGTSDGTTYNLNSLTTTSRRGIWRLQANRNYTNAPDDYDQTKTGYLIMYSFGTVDSTASNIKQEIHYFSNSGANANVCWSRVYISGSWTEWKKNVDNLLMTEGAAADAFVVGTRLNNIMDKWALMSYIEPINSDIDDKIAQGIYYVWRSTVPNWPFDTTGLLLILNAHNQDRDTSGPSAGALVQMAFVDGAMAYRMYGTNGWGDWKRDDTDATLAIEGRAADAKAVGDKALISKQVYLPIGDNANLNNFYTQGIYSVMSPQGTQNWPFENTWGIFVVLNSNNATGSFSAYSVVQLAFCEGKYAFRTSITGQSGPKYSDWVVYEIDDTLSIEGAAADAKAVGDAISSAVENVVSSKGLAMSTDPEHPVKNLNEYKTPGIYYVGATRVTNWAFDDNYRGVLIVFNPMTSAAAMTDGIVQMAFSNGELAYRMFNGYGSGQTELWSDWIKNDNGRLLEIIESIADVNSVQNEIEATTNQNYYLEKTSATTCTVKSSTGTELVIYSVAVEAKKNYRITASNVASIDNAILAFATRALADNVGCTMLIDNTGVPTIDYSYSPTQDGYLFLSKGTNASMTYKIYEVKSEASLIAEDEIWRANGFVSPYATNELTITKNGTTISFHCGRYMVYNFMDNTWRIFLNDNTIEVPHDRFVIYNDSVNEIQIKTKSELDSLDSRHAYLLFYNSNGSMRGPWEKYYLTNNVKNDVISVRNDINNIIWDVADRNDDEFIVNPGPSNSIYPLPFKTREAGEYFLVCYQQNDGAFSNDDFRNCFLYQYVNSSGSVVTVYDSDNLKNTAAGLKVWRIKLDEEVEARFGRWITNNSSDITFTNFMLIRNMPFSNYPGELYSITRGLDAEIFWYGRNNPSIAYTLSTNVYTITLPTSTNLRIICGGKTNFEVLAKTCTQTGSVFELAHNQFFVFDISDGLFKVISDRVPFNDENIIVCLYNSAGNLIGNWKRYYQDAVIYNVGNNTGTVYPYGLNVPTFETDGTNIIFYCQRMIVRSPSYLINGPAYGGKMIRMDEALTVPHNSYCIYNMTTDEIESKSERELMNAYDQSFIVMFYNSNGLIKGDWLQYKEFNDFSSNVDLYFYGRNSRPTFSIDANSTITVTVPTNARTNWIRTGNVTNKIQYVGDTSFVSEGDTFVVPHNSSLVFDFSENKIEVVSGSTYAYNSKKQLLFYNSQGSVNGPWRLYWLENKLINSSSNVPEYYTSQVTSKTEDVVTRLANSFNNFGFIFITDIHYPSNMMNSPSLVQDVCRRTGITSVHLNGDYINREGTKEAAISNISRVIGQYQYAGLNIYASVGNHEWNNPAARDDEEYLAAQLNEAQLKWCTYSSFRNKATFDPDSLAYYYDDPSCKVRYFVGAVGRGTNPIVSTITWIAKELESVPSGYSVVVFFHTIIHNPNNTPTIVGNASILENVLNAVHDKSTYTYGGVTYNYTNINYTLVGAFCGDYHMDFDYTTSSGVHIIAVNTDSLQQVGDLGRTQYSVTEQSFDIVSVDTSARKIYMTRIGAGVDREFSY